MERPVRDFPISYRLYRAVALGALLALLAFSPVQAVPLPEEDPIEQAVSVSIEQRDLSVAPVESFSFSVVVEVAAPTEYLEARIRILNPSGSLLYQKTEIRHDSEPGRVSFTFERDLADLDLPEGRYPVEVRVLATGSDPVLARDRMLVIDPDREPVPVALVARFACSPATDPDGRFVVDPAWGIPILDQAMELARLADPEAAPITLGLPPVILEDWLRASSGYQTVGPEGTTEVLGDDEVPQTYVRALEAVTTSISEGALELLDVPYAEPDLAGLSAMTALEDLGEHYRHGRSVYQAALTAEPTAGTAMSEDHVPSGVRSVLAERDLDFVLLSQAAVSSGETSETPGAHPIAGTPSTGLVVDDAACEALTAETSADLIDHLFDVALSDEATRAVVAQMAFGPGRDGDASVFAAALDVLRRLPWAQAVSASAAAQTRGSEEIDLPEEPNGDAPAPIGYWEEVLEARRLAEALKAATSPTDSDADAAVVAVLVAESRCWAGPDESWGLVSRGRSYAAAATRRCEDILGSVSVSSDDLTLAGRTGKLPLSIDNGSDKNLRVVVRARSQHARVGPPDEVEVELRPAENFVTLPVSMTTALADRVVVSVYAGETSIASTTIDIRASYLDRLAIVGMVVLVLGVLLFYIRRRVRSVRSL